MFHIQYTMTVMGCFTCYSNFSLLNINEKIWQVWVIQLLSHTSSVKHTSSSRHHVNGPSQSTSFLKTILKVQIHRGKIRELSNTNNFSCIRNADFKCTTDKLNSSKFYYVTLRPEIQLEIRYEITVHNFTCFTWTKQKPRL